ncbi:histone deacetylase [Sistotremastrum suecicum HHB10207 ss-3]|uniref:histone deacetylase n=1 Tax=Sistotremastrum suecicum HHB10207 ss-3 TaxID=1314776 RepID=A0A166CIQ1_9AGAM|nr:histone deacetylase [Sistotremastrum suecicum HHB10207 ss-3]
MPGRNKRVAYLYDNDTGNFSYGLGHPMKPFRIRMAHQLVASYGMLDKMQVLRPRRSTPQEMTAFHTDEYIDFLNRVTPETAEELTGHGQRFLVGEDNPAFEGVFDFCSISAGGSIGAAQRLNIGAADIAINWAGGLHHAKKREASGFCYINDIVLAILELLRVFPRVLYIDIDCHHGDGVEEAFYTTDRVLTCSFHKFGEYFPGTGHVDDRGTGKGLGYSVNVPLKDGLTDDAFKGVFEPVIQKILEWYRPEAVVLQCGADSLSGDKLGCFNITMEGHANCVQFLRASGIPLILLGGGGYTIKNVARVWTYETACALGIQDTIDPNLPWNEYFEWFGPRYRLEVPETNMEDVNIRDGHLEHIKSEVLRHLEDLPFAPSVGMHHVPTESIGDHLGYSMQEDHHPEELSDLDEMIAGAYYILLSSIHLLIIFIQLAFVMPSTQIPNPFRHPTMPICQTTVNPHLPYHPSIDTVLLAVAHISPSLPNGMRIIIKSDIHLPNDGNSSAVHWCGTRVEKKFC